MFFKERAAASERKCAAASLNYVPLRNILKQKQRKLKMMFMYFWLNYCDENHVERIPIAVKNINHLFHLASEIIEADRLHLFLLSDGTRTEEDEYLNA